MADRQARLITKRTSVPGKIPTGTTGSETNLIQSGELASNLSDKKLYGYDGTDVFEYGSNSFLGLTGGTITGDTRVIGSFSASTIFSGNTDLYNIFSTTSQNNALYVNKTGDTMTGPLYVPSISATTIYGNGANITGITGSFGITVDGSSSVLTTGVKGFIVMPYNATIIGWDIIGNTSGNCVFDIWKSSGLTIPTVINTITGSEKPTLNSQQINSDNTLSSWSTEVFINDIIAFNVDSATTISRINLIIKVIKK